ncbi:MAG: hypothetical protein ACMG6H_14125, partial [Acidobacteriota bacterium]
IFGHPNNGAVRIVQAMVDTATCALVALLAFYWQPDEKRKRMTAIAALALAAVCPFTTIYSATILTEVPATFLVMAMFLAATLALRKTFLTEDTQESKDKGTLNHLIRWWLVAGLLGGLAVLFRPDTGLFVAAVGLTLVIIGLRPIWSAVAKRARDGAVGLFPSPIGRGARGEGLAHSPSFQASPVGKANKTAIENSIALRLRPLSRQYFLRTLAAGALFSLAFTLVLAPWTIRNARVFHLFQPLAPSHGEMPGEFVPRGYYQWLRTWLDHERYVAPFLWSLDSEPIDIDDVPASAFDSAEEKDRVAALLDKYNHPAGAQVTTGTAQPQPNATPSPSPTPTPANSKTSNAKATPTPTTKSRRTSKAEPTANANAKDEEDTGDESDQNDSSDQGDEADKGDESDQPEEHGPVEMTPEIDAGFAQLARERIARHSFRFYVLLPLKRAHTMWFDTHAQYWPFEGDLLPLEDLDYEHHQQYWLPLFAGLTAIYTLLGLAGAWLLWDSVRSAARGWLLLTALAILLRLILFSSMENPEPRYLVEFFPFLAILGGIAIARVAAMRSVPGAVETV